MKQPVGDIVFTIAAWALAAYAGRVLFGQINGVALWRVFFAAGAAGGVIGIMVSGRYYGPRRPRSVKGKPPSWIPPAPPRPR
jgi:hypothetical protein